MCIKIYHDHLSIAMINYPYGFMVGLKIYACVGDALDAGAISHSSADRALLRPRQSNWPGLSASSPLHVHLLLRKGAGRSASHGLGRSRSEFLGRSIESTLW